MASCWVRLLAEDSGVLGGQVGWDSKAASCLQQLVLWSIPIVTSKHVLTLPVAGAYGAVGIAVAIDLQLLMDGSDGIIHPVLWLNPPYCIKGSCHSIYLKRRYWFLMLSISTKRKTGGWDGGSWMSPKDVLLYLRSNYTQKEDLPRVIIFPLPFRPALTNFKDSIMKKAFKTHMHRIALESANAYGALCWLEQQAGGCFITYQWFGFVNEKFRGNCIILNSDYHRGRDASDILMQWVSTILMEICWNQRSLPPRKKRWKTAREIFYLWDERPVFWGCFFH